MAVIDGEHYPPVVRDALAELSYDVVAAVLVGGAEKLRDDPEYRVPLSASLETAIAEHAPDVVIDLSDEPVLGPPERMALASRALALGVPYEGADFRFDPPVFEPFALPSIAVGGPGSGSARPPSPLIWPRVPRPRGRWSCSRWGEVGRASPS